jgi:hypothetical protein
VAEEYDVKFHSELFQRLKDAATIKAVTSCMPEELAKQTRAILFAFLKNGVPPDVVLKALTESMQEGGLDDGH